MMWRLDWSVWLGWLRSLGHIEQMSHKLSYSLSTAAKNMRVLEELLIPYCNVGSFQCSIQEQKVFLKFEHSMNCDELSLYSDKLFEVCSIRCKPVSGGYEIRNMMSHLCRSSDTVKLGLDLSYDEDESLLIQYLCSELVSFFKKYERKSKR